MPVRTTIQFLMQFGRLFILREVRRRFRFRRRVECICECGSVVEADLINLLASRTRSCGCYQKEQTSKSRTRLGGEGGSAEYLTWGHMIQRCHNPANKSYSYYGGRGIFVCERWGSDFLAFLSDMGKRPRGHSIDRWPDTNGNYEPGNCRWATKIQQMRNTRETVRIMFGGADRVLQDVCEEIGFPVLLARWRKLHGWSDADLFLPTMRPHAYETLVRRRRGETVTERKNKVPPRTGEMNETG